jgi:hypothetical protein
MPRKTTKKKIDKKVKKTKSRPAVALAVREARLQSSSPSLKGSMAKNHRADSAPSRSREGEGMFRWSPLSIILRQQALATAMFMSLTQIWSQVTSGGTVKAPADE